MAAIDHSLPPRRRQQEDRLRLDPGLRLGGDLRQALLAHSRLRRYRAGETILGADSEPAVVGSIVSGIARIALHDRQGAVQLVGFLVRSDLFGHRYARLGPFSLEAATEMLVCQFDRHAFNALVQRHSALREHLIGQTLEELEGTREWLSLLGTRDAIGRVASFLLVLLHHRSGERTSGAPEGEVLIPISRSDVANFLSMTPETLSRCLHRLADDGTLGLLAPGRIRVLDEAALRRASDGCEIPLSDSVVRTCRAFSSTDAARKGAEEVGSNVLSML